MKVDFDEVKEVMELWYNQRCNQPHLRGSWITISADKIGNYSFRIDEYDFKNMGFKIHIYDNSKQFLDKIKELTRPKSKFNVGDTVYYLYIGACYSSLVDKITFPADKEEHYYSVRNPNLSSCNLGYCFLSESSIFKSKDEAIDNAIKNTDNVIKNLESQRDKIWIGEEISYDTPPKFTSK